ncbi:juvenile hormone esterase-like isoform X1 [Pieris rapae]|uniref:juvenile hormone esterase-like isoform X1 n=2 Tax=Pieris rapae TaxID=64459 RepID=UPI001E281315|nr:juvenile hormone esterase-like isoform X1 [Pieris rapae]
MSNTLWNLIIITLIAYYTQIIYNEWSRPMVLTKNGWIRGLRSEEGYDLYLGIPYAKVREDNPFTTSSPYPRWKEIFDASDNTKLCPHVEEALKVPVGTLQCLNLHIYAPRKGKRLPVIVFIYGGQYRFGHAGRIGSYAVYIPEFFVQNNVIVVTFNYRSGAYGFLCLDTPEIPGNQGLKDQTLALQWIKENIENFGGNSNRITILGHSSGAMSTEFHVYANPHLFNQFILQSGSAFVPGGIGEADTKKPIKIAKTLGYEATTLNDAIKFLAKVDVQAVATATKSLVFRPCIEKRFAGVKGFLHEHPVNMKLDLSNKTVLIGNTKREYAKEICLPYNAIDSKDVVKINLNIGFEHNDDIVDRIKRYYDIHEKEGQDEYENVLKFFSDLYFNYPTDRTINKYLGSGAKKIYQYVFSYSGNRNLMKVMRNISVEATTHGDDLGYLFKMTCLEKTSDSDQLLVDRMVKMWTDFAKYGDPTPKTSNLLPVKWVPTTKQRKYLIIDTVMRMDDTLLHDRIKFWRNLYKTYEKFVKWES